MLTDVVFLERGRIALCATMDDVESRFRELRVHPDHAAQARDLAPIHERESLGRHIMLFDGVDADRLTPLGDVRAPSLADLVLARVGSETGREVG